MPSRNSSTAAFPPRGRVAWRMCFCAMLLVTTPAHPAAEGGKAVSYERLLAPVKLNPSRVRILTGDSPEARQAGVRAGEERVTVRRIVDARRPELAIYWADSLEIPRYSLPEGSRVFARERWSGAPVMAGLPGGALWLATDPGERGFERYPYVAQALADLGAEPQSRAQDLWAFFDSSYRLRADLPLLARRWRQAGIAAIHVAAWHYWEPDAARDEWLARLIAECHRNAVAVYAWVEFPHVSERFWEEHPEWREKTAIGSDAHLDWRKLINLQNRDAAQEVERGLRALAARFDWDGLNLGELYFESLEGASNPARFTPFNADVRKQFAALHGRDPLELFRRGGENSTLLRRFLDYRVELARQMQAEWLTVAESIRRERGGLDVVLTHVDDRFDPSMRDLLGADAAGALPLLDRLDFTFMVEDPATVWHLGPQRYPEIARRYRPLTTHRERLAIDINIVERYQDAYPTKQQTGMELFQLVHMAAQAFERVALYFENSILAPDIGLLSAAASTAAVRRDEAGVWVETVRDALVAWEGPALLDGKPWPLYDGRFVRVPPGRHRIEPGVAGVPQVLDVNARVVSAAWDGEHVSLEYESRTRAFIRTAAGTETHPAGRHRIRLRD